jgi:glyoxylase-like metal-dependent hydrolase (beta-lactamase superfamily II)
LDFLTEPEPLRGVALPVAEGVRRMVARNPGPMTYRGTNTYLLDQPDGVAVLDPGPDDPAHVADVLREASAPIRRILLTHGHHDHFGAVAALRAASGAPVHACKHPAVPGFTPDLALEDEDEAAPGLVALHTPGHAADHLCFAASDGTVFTGDHVMSWSSSVVSPPGGDMAAYMRGLERLLARRHDRRYLPGHGPPLQDPHPFVRDLLDHRRVREAAILALLGEVPRPPREFVGLLYPDLDPRLRAAAERSVLAHLLTLAAERRAAQDADGFWRRA